MKFTSWTGFDGVASAKGKLARIVSAMLFAGVSTASLQTAAKAADLARITPIAPAPVASPFFLFSDTILEYRHEFRGTDPGIANKFPKEIANITHVDAFKYGTNFISADVLTSTNADPTAPGLTVGSQSGSRELYFIYRGTLSGNAVTNSKAFNFGFIKDVSLEYGVDVESQNTAFAPQKTLFVIGPQISFDVPGLLTFSAHFSKEWNHNGLAGPIFGLPSNSDYNAATGDVSFRPAAEFEMVYLQPLKFTGLPLTLNGFANIILPKGLDGFGNKTRTEFLTENRLTLDASSYFGRPKLVDLFVGYKLWLDKFGNEYHYGRPGYTPGSYENQIFTGIDIHLQ